MQDVVPPPDSPNDHASHGEWYELYHKEEMKDIEDAHRARAGIKTTQTVKKRKRADEEKVGRCRSFVSE